MTTGAVILAFNNEATDYVGMACWSAANIKRHLGLPTAVITNQPQDPRLCAVDCVITASAESGGTRYFEDYNATVTWHNAGRPEVYELSPWQQTLLLDADYVVASDQLSTLLASNQDFLCHGTAVDAARGQELTGLNTFGNYKMPMAWATVVMFRKSQYAQTVFACMNMIRNNWQHYCDLYGITKRTYRNDFALSIALGIANGHTPRFDTVPWNLVTVLTSDLLVQKSQDHYEICYTTADKRQRRHAIVNQDFHAMGKASLEAIIAAHD